MEKLSVNDQIIIKKTEKQKNYDIKQKLIYKLNQ